MDRRLPYSGLALRIAPGTRGRTALEVHDQGELVDVSVATDIAHSVVRGAWRTSWDEKVAWSVAWGQLPPGVDRVEVRFRRRGRTETARKVDVLGRYWAAEVPGRYRKVIVSGSGVVRTATKMRTREKTRRENRPQWDLATAILRPEDEAPVLPDLRSVQSA